jgi:exodeoxyribonuclease VII large subunit
MDSFLGDTPLTPSEFVALANQVFETAFPLVVIEGELSEFKISKDRWVFLKLKDKESVVDFFGTVYHLKHPLEDGMMVRIVGRPKLSPRYGFSVNIEQIAPVGEGAIRRAFDLLKAKLDKEGLFDEAKKRSLPVIPKTIGLISSQAAAGATDFLTILKQRWGGVEVKFASVQVQGEAAPEQIVGAINYFNGLPVPVDVLVLVRGGGSLEDLLAFNTEIVARAVRSSLSPIVVGVGHEDDVSLADLAADVRAATPTHAASLVVPDKSEILARLEVIRGRLASHVENQITGLSGRLKISLVEQMHSALSMFEQKALGYKRSLRAYDPQAALRRGYSVISLSGKVIASTAGVKPGDTIEARLSDGQIDAEVLDVRPS